METAQRPLYSSEKREEINIQDYCSAEAVSRYNLIFQYAGPHAR